MQITTNGITLTVNKGMMKINDNNRTELSIGVPYDITDIIVDGIETEPFDFGTIELDCDCEQCNNKLRVFDSGTIEIITDDNVNLYHWLKLEVASSIARWVLRCK